MKVRVIWECVEGHVWPASRMGGIAPADEASVIVTLEIGAEICPGCGAEASMVSFSVDRDG